MFEIGKLARLTLGHVQENHTTNIEIDMRPWLEDMPDGEVSVWCVRHGEEMKAPYPAIVEMVDGILNWKVNSFDTELAGVGLCIVSMTSPAKQRRRSRDIKTIVDYTKTGVAGEEAKDKSPWVEEVLNAGKKAMEAWQNIGERIRPEVQEWLAAHPEATTTVQDGAVAMGKLNNDVLYNLRGKTVHPIYLGDYITDKIPSCCLKVDDMYYLFDGLNEPGHGDNNANVYIYRDNQLIETKSVELGHANSACYDGQYIYIAPCNDYSGASVVGGQPIIRYSKDFTSKEIVRTPYSAPSVSYDPITHQVFALCWKYDAEAGKHTKEYVYRINGTTCEYYAECELPWPIPSAEGQDFAVYGEHYLRSAAAGIIAIGRLDKPTATIESFVTVSTIDQNGRWKTGELEGMEFGADGVLYATKYTWIGDKMTNGFLVALPIVSEAKPPITSSMVFSDALFGVNLVTGNGTLAPAQTQIRSINQLNNLLPEISTIVVNGEQTDGRVEIMEDIAIELRGTLHMETLYLAGGTCNISADSATNMLDIANHTIFLRRAGELGISGEYPLNVTGERFDVDAGYSYGITRVRSLPNKPLFIGGVQATTIGVYTGAGRLARASEITADIPVVEGGSVSQVCEAGTKTYSIPITFSKRFTGVPSVTVSLLTETSNQRELEKFVWYVSNRSKTGFTLNIYYEGTTIQRTPYFTWIAVM